ncbi:MAG: helix-turn-helix domain-containing protein [Patescibacteria group bacterium]|nr:helix-turn-helix domain-containing protein [Patescibacteria group bacterium]
MTETSPQQFGTFLHERVRDKNWTVEKLSQMSNISIAHLEHLIAGNFEALPPSPYVHGYLHKLGTVLDFDGEAWWRELKAEGVVRASGSSDALPINRFKEKSSAPMWIAGVGVVLLIYLGVRFVAIFGTPLLIVEYPPRGITPAETEEITVRGSLSYGEKATVNGESVPVNDQGDWEKRVMLHEGLNTIEVTGTRFLGSTANVTRQVLYTPAIVITTSTAQ